MVILIGGASHTGKTLLAQRILETHHIPYLSMDHLKMGLIRSGQTNLTVLDDDALTDYLWPIVREMVKTAIENKQNLVVEGCYIPHSWREDFSYEYLKDIRCRFLVMTPRYIHSNFRDIQAHACDIEARLDDSWISVEALIRENDRNYRRCLEHGCEMILLDRGYFVDSEVLFS